MKNVFANIFPRKGFVKSQVTQNEINFFESIKKEFEEENVQAVVLYVEDYIKSRLISKDKIVKDSRYDSNYVIRDITLDGRPRNIDVTGKPGAKCTLLRESIIPPSNKNHELEFIALDFQEVFGGHANVAGIYLYPSVVYEDIEVRKYFGRYYHYSKSTTRIGAWNSVICKFTLSDGKCRIGDGILHVFEAYFYRDEVAFLRHNSLCVWTDDIEPYLKRVHEQILEQYQSLRYPHLKDYGELYRMRGFNV